MTNTHACRLLRTMLAGLTLTSSVRAQLYADFQTTKGSFSVELFHQDVPRTVANFGSLAEGTRPWMDARTNRVRVGVPFYDGITFHRVAAIPTLIIQAGSPKGDGTDGPGYKFPDEFSKDAAGQLLHKHVAGALSMANAGVQTNGSQFFLIATGAPLTELDDKHTVFGKIAAGPSGTAAQGQAVVDAISTVPLGAQGRPVTDVVIQHIAIRRVGASATAFNPLAWQLPEVGGEVDASLVYLPGATPAATNVELTYPGRKHRAYSFDYSFELKTWDRLALGNSSTTLIQTTDVPEPLTVTGVGEFPEAYFRTREIDYSALIARTLPSLSPALSVRLKFTTPVIEGTITRNGAGGTWTKVAAPGTSWVINTFGYAPGGGDAGLFRPLISLTFTTTPLPWTTGVALKSLTVGLSFDAASTTQGSFVASGFSTTNGGANPDAGGKGVFTILVP